jgi:hypothetical protein
MAQDVSMDYGPGREPDQLSDGEQARLRELSRRQA